MIISILIIILCYVLTPKRIVMTDKDENMGKHRRIKLKRKSSQNTTKTVNDGTKIKKLKIKTVDDLKLFIVNNIIKNHCDISRYEFLSEFIQQYVTLCKSLEWVKCLPKNIIELEDYMKLSCPELYNDYVNKLKQE